MILLLILPEKYKRKRPYIEQIRSKRPFPLDYFFNTQQKQIIAYYFLFTSQTLRICS